MNNHYFHDTKGERKDQLLITVDKNGHRIGTATREECHGGEGKTHLAFMALIIKSDKVILTKRSKKKSLWGGFWDASIVSHVLPDETIEEAAKRRGKEELGVEVDFKDLGAFYYFAKHENGVENEYCHVLVGKIDGNIYPNQVEIEEIKPIGINELKKEIQTNLNSFTPWLKLALEKYKI